MKRVCRATKGLAPPEVEAVYTRALALCRQVGETPQLFPVLWGLRRFYLARAEYQTARELAEQLFLLARRVQDPALLVEASFALGTVLWSVGEFALAQEHMEQALALYNPQQHRSHAFLYGLDPRVACLSFAGIALWYLGYPAQALTRIDNALTLARELAHPLILAFALTFAARLHQFRREGQAAQERAEAAIALSSEQGFAPFLAEGTSLRGWALAEQEQKEEGIAQICQDLAASRATGTEMNRPYVLALLAEAYGKAGQAEDGLAALTEALTVVDKSGERFYEAELYRLKGELLLNAERGMQNDERNTKAEEQGPAPIHHSSFIVSRRPKRASLKLSRLLSGSRRSR